jgi:hypothetical protein
MGQQIIDEDRLGMGIAGLQTNPSNSNFKE